VRAVDIGKIVGLSGDGWWAQVHDFTPEDEGRARTLGRLVAVVCIRVGSENAVDIVSTGREVLSRLHELYYGETGGEAESGINDRLKRAVERLEEEYGGIELGMMVLEGDRLHMTAIGGVKAWAREGGKEGWLIGQEPAGDRVRVLTGQVREGMTIVVGNPKFWQELPEGVMRAVAAREVEGAEELAEAVGSVLFGRRKSEGEVGVVIRPGTGEGADARHEDSIQEAEVVAQEDKKPSLRRGGIMGRAREMWGDVKSRIPAGPAYNIQAENSPILREGSRKRARQVGVVFLVVAVVLFAGGRVWRQSTDANRQAQDERVEAIVNQYQEAKSLIGLNQTRARQMLAEVRTQIDQLEPKVKEDGRIAGIVNEYGEVLGAASGVKRVEGAEVVDLGLVRENLTGMAMVKSDDKLWVAGNEGQIVEIDPARKNGQVRFGGSATMLAAYPGRIYTWSGDGVSECAVPGSTCTKRIDPDGEWGEIVDMEAWAANVYLLDRQKGEIWRYAGGEAGFGSRQKWLRDTTLGQHAESMTIDGSIWTLSEGRVGKYTQGVNESFSVSGLDKDIGGRAKVYTDETAKRLYVLDPENNRVMAIAKQSGEYEEQWEWDKMAEVTDLVVDEANKKMYLVGGRYVWEIDI